MPHWLQIVIAAATVIASWRWVIRPVRRFFGELLTLLRQIRASSGGLEKLAREIEALAGSITRLVVSILDDLAALRGDQAQLREQQRELLDMVIDATADVRRMEKKGRP